MLPPGGTMALTGQFKIRRTFQGKLVLQVEQESPSLWSWCGSRRRKRRWRDATLIGMSAPVLRILLDWGL